MVFPGPTTAPYQYSYRIIRPVFLSAYSIPITLFEAAAVISIHAGEHSRRMMTIMPATP